MYLEAKVEISWLKVESTKSYLKVKGCKLLAKSLKKLANFKQHTLVKSNKILA